MVFKISIGIAILGLVPLLIVLWKRKRIKNLVTKGDIVTGTVLEVNKFRGYKGNVYYQALIEDPVFNQGLMRGNYAFSGQKGLQLFYKGRRIEVFYDKKKPKRFIPKEALSNPALYIITIIIAVGYLVLSYFLYNWLTGQGLS
jgi:hypothetical protein